MAKTIKKEQKGIIVEAKLASRENPARIVVKSKGHYKAIPVVYFTESESKSQTRSKHDFFDFLLIFPSPGAFQNRAKMVKNRKRPKKTTRNNTCKIIRKKHTRTHRNAHDYCFNSCRWNRWNNTR